MSTWRCKCKFLRTKAGVDEQGGFYCLVCKKPCDYDVQAAYNEYVNRTGDYDPELKIVESQGRKCAFMGPKPPPPPYQSPYTYYESGKTYERP